MLFDIDKIMDMIDCNNSIEIQEKGIELAKNIKSINAFILPVHPGCNKNVWENCAKILAGRTDKELVPYLTDILLWIEDMNWPGAMIILERMKNFSDVRTLSLAIQETISILDASNRENREVWLMVLSELLDNEKLEKELPINTLSELKRYYYKKEDFIERYTFYITKIQDAILENNYINNNIYEQKLKALNEEYEKEEYYIEALNELMENESFIIAMEAIKDCFKHNINIDKARKKVEELLKIEDVRIVSIKDWKAKHQKEKKEDV